MKYIFSLLLLLAFALPGNAQTSVDTVHKILDTLVVKAQKGPGEYRATATSYWDIKNTRIALSFDWKAKKAHAREWIKLHPYFYATDSLVLDAKTMKIDSVQLVNKKKNINLNYTYANNYLKIHFDRPYKASDTIELYLKYTAMPDEDTTSGGNLAIYETKGLYFINTDYSIPYKPAQIWTQGETEYNSHWMITIDKPNTRFTTQIELTVPDSFATLSNGAMVKQIKTKNGMHTDIWKMNMPIQAYAAMFAIGKYSIIKDHWKNKEVNYYVEPEYAPYARKMFNNTTEMIDYFSQITGVSYPWNKYDQVVVRDYVSGAMENTTASLFGEFMNQNFREMADENNEDVVSHELFHQWFGDYVTCKSWANITVNESFADYSEQLWRAHKYGKVSGDVLAYSKLQTYLSSTQLTDPPLVRYYYDDREDVFDRVSYEKGGCILRYMNSLMGDSAFYKAMKIYLTKNALQAAGPANWKLAVEEVTGQDWDWFFNEWYFHGGHPVVKVNYDYDDATQKLILTVKQTQEDSSFIYDLPMKAAIVYGNEKTVVEWDIDKLRDTFIYNYKNGLKPLIIPDCTHVLPGELKDGKKMPQWLEQYKQSDDYISKQLAVSAAGKLMSDSNAQAILDLALNDNMHAIRQSALGMLKIAQMDKYHKKWTLKVTEMAAHDSNHLVRTAAYEVLGAWKAGTAKREMLDALNDSSYYVSGAALNALYQLDKDTAYVIAKKMLATGPLSTLETTIWNIIGKKAADADISLYEQYAPYIFSTRRLSFAMNMSSYLNNVKSEQSFEEGVNVFMSLVTSEPLKPYRSALGTMFFGVAENYKDNLKSDNKDDVANARKRLAVLKPALGKVMAAEKDKNVLKDFKKLMKDDFND